MTAPLSGQIERISLSQARRIALAAQGLAEPRPVRPLTARHVRRTINRLGLLQIDSVSVVARAHYLPLFSRLGAYPRTLLEDAAWGRRPELFEYWAHEASLLPHAAWPLLRWRMKRAAQGVGIYGGLARFAEERSDFVAATLEEVRKRGPIFAGDLEGERGPGGWWGWGEGKRALEFLFWAGEVTVAGRRGFERIYDLPERALPKAVFAAPEVREDDAQRMLLGISAAALGIMTASDLRDYFRLSPDDVKARLPEMVEEGTLRPVQVAGWTQAAYLHRDARRPRKVEARALLAPFDPLVFERGRTERLFGFRYRIEIYVPAEKRVHGYYVLPFLLGEHLVARVDLKSDRAARTLRVQSAFAEPDAPPHTAEALAAELRLMAIWLDLDDIVVSPRGDLAEALAETLTKLR